MSYQCTRPDQRVDAARLEHDGVLAEIPASPRTATSDASSADAAFHTGAGAAAGADADAIHIRGQISTRSKPMVGWCRLSPSNPR